MPPDVAKLDREALEHRLAEAEARLEPMLPADERFEHEERAPEYEVRLQPYLDELFDVHPGEEANYQLECHGRFCKLDSNESSIDWRTELQTDIDAIGLFRFNELTEGSVYLSIPEKAQTEAAGTRLAIRVFQSLLMSPLVASCKSEHPERGLIELALRFDHTTRRLSAVATGSLADKPSGRCIRKVLDDILATTNVPSDVTVVPEWAVPVGIP